MPGKIEVTVVPTSLVITSGDTTEASATLRNSGQTVDQFTISLEGLDPSWYTLPVSSVALFPNDEDKLRIILHPPKTGEVKAGSYPFSVNVHSQENPELTNNVSLSIEIRALPEVELTISPQRLTGSKGTYKIEVKNPSDSDAMLSLKATDAQGVLRYALRPDRLKIPANNRAEASLDVRLGWMALFGSDKEFDFQVIAELPELEEPKAVTGQLVRVSWYKTLRHIRLPQIRLDWLQRIRIPWLTNPPKITDFKASTDDRRDFRLNWSVKRASEVLLDEERVKPHGEILVSPAETTRYTITASNRYGSTKQSVEVKPLPVPEAKASERIRVSFSPIILQVQSGGPPVTATLQLQNLGDIVDKFLVEIEGLDNTWYSRSASSIALMPQATDQVQIPFQVPRKKGIRAKTYTFAVTVRSQSAAGEVTSVIGQLEVLPLVEFKLSVHPYRVSCRRKGTFRISLANTGVSDARFSLEATDLDEGLRFRFKNERPEVPAWKTIEVPVIASPKRGAMVGEKKRYDISLTADTGEGHIQTVNCELNHNPLIGSWRPILRFIRAIVVLGLLAVGIYYILQMGGGWGTLTSSPQSWVSGLVDTVEGWFFR